MLVQPGSSLFLLHRYLTVKVGGLDAICYSLAVPIPHVRYFVWRPPLSSLSHSEPPRNLGLSFSCRLHFINILVTRRICSRRLPQRTTVSRTSFSVFQTVRISISSLHFLSLRFLRFRKAISYTIFHILRFSVPSMMNNPPPTHPLHCVWLYVTQPPLSHLYEWCFSRLFYLDNINLTAHTTFFCAELSQLNSFL